MRRKNRSIVLFTAAAAACATTSSLLAQQDLGGLGGWSGSLRGPSAGQQFDPSFAASVNNLQSLHPNFMLSRPSGGGIRTTTSVWEGTTDLADPGSWSVATNWNPNVVPNSTTDTAVFDPTSAGANALLDVNVNVATINFSDPIGSAITSVNAASLELSTQITMSAPATIISSNSPSDAAGITFISWNAVDNVLNGSAGLTRSGGIVELTRNNVYTGATTLSSGRTTITNDSALGNVAGNLTINGATLNIRSGGLWTSARSVTIGSLGASIEAGGPMNLSGVISGSGALAVSNAGGTISNSNTLFTGALTNSSGGFTGQGLTFTGSGGMPNASSVLNEGTMVMRDSSGANHLPNSGAYITKGASLTLRNLSGGTYNEQIGSLMLDGGFSVVRLFSNSGGSTTLTAAALDRGSLHGGIKFSGNNLGQTPGPDNTNIFFTSVPATVNGFIPFAWANGASNQLAVSPNSPDNTLVTYNATTGVTPLPIASYANTTVGATIATNVRLENNETIASAVSLNALVLAAPADNVGGLDIGGGGTISVDSGIVLSANAGGDGAGGPNDFPGNILRNPLAFGSKEAVFLTPGSIAQTGVISGTGGLSKIGGEYMVFIGNNTYTGTTTISGVNFFFNNILSDGVTAGPFGRSTTPIVAYSGSTYELDPLGQNVGFAQTALGVGSGTGPLVFNRPINFRGVGFTELFSGAPSLTYNGAWDINAGLEVSIDPGTSPFILNNTISGAGVVVNGGSTVTFNGNNTWTGGLRLDGGFTAAGTDTAFGTGPTFVFGDATLSASGGARTLSNPFVLTTNGALTITGANPLTIAGPIDLIGGNLLIVDTGSTATFSGVMSRDGLFKTGSGTLVLTGNNTFKGTLSAGNGPDFGGMIILRGTNASGGAEGQTQAVAGSTVALDGGATTATDELFIFEDDGVGGLGALRSLTGNNTWGGTALGISTLSNSVGVDGGSTLTIAQGLLTNDGTDVIPMAKVGTGQLNVGSTNLNGFPTYATSTANAGIFVKGPLQVNGGKVKVLPATPANSVVSVVQSVSIAGGPSAPTATLDLSNTSMLVDYTGPSPISDIRRLLKSGYAGGLWTGNGITSSSAATSPNPGELHKTALGYGEANDPNLHAVKSITTYKGITLDTTTLIIKYTYFGDADLDGDADGVDISTWATNFSGELGGGPTATRVWTQGDWDYDGDVDGVDAGLWAASFTGELGGGGLGSLVINDPTMNPQAAAILTGLGITVVPEPVAACGIGFGLLAAGAMRRRRRDTLVR